MARLQAAEAGPLAQTLPVARRRSLTERTLKAGRGRGGQQAGPTGPHELTHLLLPLPALQPASFTRRPSPPPPSFQFDLVAREEHTASAAAAASSNELFGTPTRASSFTAETMREIVHIQAGQCGNQIGAKVRIRD